MRIIVRGGNRFMDFVLGRGESTAGLMKTKGFLQGRVFRSGIPFGHKPAKSDAS